MSWLLEPYQSSFMLRALAAVVIIGTFSPMVGVWIVLRRLSYLGDAMSHALLAGVAASVLLGISISIGALVTGLVMAALLSLLGLHPRLHADAVIGVVETLLFGFGLVLLSVRSDQIGYDISHLLLGQVSTTTPGDLIANLVLAAVGTLVLVGLFHDLRAATFDPIHASLVGIRTGLLSWLLLSLLAAAIVVSLQTVGLLMSVAMLITPPAAARLITDRVAVMTAVAVAIGLGSGVIGLTASYHLDAPPGATISLIAVAVLLAILAASAGVSRYRNSNRDREKVPCDESVVRLEAPEAPPVPRSSNSGPGRSSTSART